MATLRGLDIGLNDSQIYELMRDVDTEHNAQISMEEFTNSFQVGISLEEEKAKNGGSPSTKTRQLQSFPSSSTSTKSSQKKKPKSLRVHTSMDVDPSMMKYPVSAQTPINQIIPLNWAKVDKWTLECLRTISCTMYQKEKTLQLAFNLMDPKRTGYVTQDAFVQGLKTRYKLQLEDADSIRLFQAIDTQHKGRMNYVQFLGAFQVTNNSASNWQHNIIQQVANTLYQHRVHIRQAFRIFDPTNKGRSHRRGIPIRHADHQRHVGHSFSTYSDRGDA